jgi:tetraacyldisaccharide-1-P 4'-kinase
MKDDDIDDFGLNWRSIEKSFIEISNPNKFLEILEAAGIETYKNHSIKINNIPKKEIKKIFLKENKTMTVKELKKITENLDDETQVFVTFADESLSSADEVIDAYIVSGSKEEINGLYLERY